MAASIPAPFPASLAYDSKFKWWSGTAELSRFSKLRIDVAGRHSKSSVTDLLVKIPRQSVAVGQYAIAEAQANAYIYLFDNEQRIVDVCLAAIAGLAHEQRPVFAHFLAPNELEEFLPEDSGVEQLRNRVRLTTVLVTARQKESVAYVGYHFGCAWDQEHGLLIVLHRDRVVFSGGSGDGWADR